MAESLFSPNWYRVASLTPKLRSHAQIHRHQYRGQVWYVLQDRSSERFHRFSPPAYLIIGMMDGHRTVQDIWSQALAKLGDEAVTQDEVIQLLSQLHAADVLQSDVPPDAAEMFRRREKQERQVWQKRVMSVFAWQIPLFDPERLLNRLMPFVRPIFTRAGLALWFVVVLAGTVLAGSHWRDLTENMLDRVLLPENLLVMWLVFPVLKALHEFGHAFSVKAYGGEVHEMGVMILVLTPVPYVDASASWGFRSKWERFLVGAAGMMTELFIASLALFVWLAIEPSFLRALLYNVILIAGVSTVVFNANPLLRFDGYYMLMDWLEIPNLRSRATQYFVYLAERYLFGRREAEPPVSTGGERRWFVLYSIASFIYRILVVVGILVYLGEVSLLLGVVFALFTAIAWLVVPAVKIGTFVLASPRVRRVRHRAITTTAGIILGVLALLFVVPVPFHTMAEGVIWIPEEGLARAGADGFVHEVVAAPGKWVKTGDILVEARDPDLVTEAAVLEARVRELEARYREAFQVDKVKAEVLAEEQRFAMQSLDRARERLADLTVKAKAEGEFVMPLAADAPGRYVKKGELLGHVVNLEVITVRTVVPQQDIDLVRNATADVHVRLAENLAQVNDGHVKRIVPSASDRLPSPALGSQGGGQAALDPSDREGRKSVQKYFQIDVEMPSSEKLLNAGGRAHIRFDHGWAPIGVQWYRRARLLFLSRFNV